MKTGKIEFRLCASEVFCSLSRQIKVKNEMQSKTVPESNLESNHSEAQDHCSADNGM